MSRDILKQLQVGDKVWIEVYVTHAIDKEGDIQVEGYSYGGKENMYVNRNTNFSLSNPNELTVKELCEWIEKKGYGKGFDAIELYGDCSGGSRDGVIDFNNLETLTELVREPNFQRKEEIKKQIEELQKELKEL